MAGVEPYSPCPCGSGQKFKWCCHKVEPFAEKSQRLYDGGQHEAALKVLDEGLKKEPGNPWLLIRKALIQIRDEQPGPAKETLRQVLQKNPTHYGALMLLTRCVLVTEGPVNAAGLFQQALGTVEGWDHPELAALVRVIATLLAEVGIYPAAIVHLELAIRLDAKDRVAPSTLRNLLGSPNLSPWLKDRRALAPAPAHLDDQARRDFESGLKMAEHGLWAPAAAAFDRLAGRDPGGEADYNLGLCRLWLGDEPGALGPFRNRIRRLGNSPEAVDLEALCQQIEPTYPQDRVDRIKLTWPLRNREGLLAALRGRPDAYDQGGDEPDPDQPDAPVVDDFALLDRPRLDPQDGRSLKADQVPRILGHVLVGQDLAELETYDDGRLDSLGDRFTALAGSTIAPAHPRTTILGSEARSTLAIAWEWLFPEEVEPAEADRLNEEERSRVIREVWPITPMPYLGFRTPEAAARDGDAEVPLRAALCQFELRRPEDGAEIRARLGIPPEPPIDPATVDLGTLPIGRFRAVPVDQLDDARLATFYRNARDAQVDGVLEPAARAVASRPGLVESGQVDRFTLFSDLAALAANRGDKAEMADWVDRGRRSGTVASRPVDALIWDLVELRLLPRLEPPEAWVPALAVLLERHNQDPRANQIILMSLVEMGLVRILPDPDNRGEVLIDSRLLQAMLAEYGPRVTTASGQLGVSAAKPEIWTPGSTAPGGGGIWTPGSGTAPAPAGDKPRLIVPGS